MKRCLLLLAALFGGLSPACLQAQAPTEAKAKKSTGQPEGFHELKIGEPAPDFELLGIDEEMHTLKEYAGADYLLVAFLSNHCPTSQAIEERLKQLARDYKSKGLRVVAINPNDPAALRPDELGYSKYNDSFPEMKRHAKEQAFNFPYLYDGETQKTALAYGCLATPHVFLFDAERKLQYQGRLDDSRFADVKTVTSTDAKNALDALLAGQPVAVPVTPPHGCSTKWISHREQVTADNEKWEMGEVTVELIDAKALAVLRKNDTQKVRLFNVWATWCGPCVKEFPELVATSRKFGLRDFEFISISMDDPETLPEVKAFLEKYNAVVPNKLKPSLKAEGRKGNAYVFNEANSDALIQALDPEWPGPIPHTLVVAPGGEVIYRHNGIVDGDDLRAKILEHMGRFYVPEQP
ncbi:redoxin family protein [Prosthecobacter dejongeii]|uniref:Thiol-disulfide isomerase/thioredoxin n=1 Tax=Prosthecobacter dejongeii TaxID=48465 RepID=A0A7W7YHD5_9BACT|nr:redoxin family protein [Prosthecobacter dejongeii]MBB5036208.1 thiol-disulfide isomerase/thioredoxin [Prosthecobacter dejongeii]